MVTCVCVGTRIITPPNSQVKKLNENATFHCVTEAPAKWWVNDTSINPISSAPVPDFLSERGFDVTFSQNQNQYNITLTVLASAQNNNTNITCQLSSSPHESSHSVMLTVIGMYNYSCTVI